MQPVRLQSIQRAINTTFRTTSSSHTRRTGFRLTRIERKSSFPFDLSTMKDAEEVEKSTFLDFTARLLGIKEKKKGWTLPNLDDFIRPDPRGRFPYEPIETPFPNPFQETPPYSAPLLLRTSQESTSPAKPIQDPLLKHLRLLFCQKGRLLKSHEGLYFVKLPDRMLTIALPFLKRQEGEIPPHFQLINYLGAHIPAILSAENIDFGVTPKEVGESFHFVITGLFEKEVDNFDEVTKIWYIAFTSYDLEWLRRKYGLTSSLAGESFHCIIGVKRGEKKEAPVQTFRISPIAQPA